MTDPLLFTVILSAAAEEDLLSISDQRTVRAIAKRIDELEREPFKQGKQLTDALKDYRSVRAAGQRYRVIFQVAMQEETRDVVVVVIGIRRQGHKSYQLRLNR